FQSYKNLCKKIADVIQELDPGFAYPRALASTLIETANNSLYFARHLPRLTDLGGEGQQLSEKVKKMMIFFTFRLIRPGNTPGSDQLRKEVEKQRIRN
ncbi:MAG: hypothetical protein KDD15_19730, partial [Lewinella sp.]|nr:hypothetical protein [Lewinella sp.]